MELPTLEAETLISVGFACFVRKHSIAIEIQTCNGYFMSGSLFGGNFSDL